MALRVTDRVLEEIRARTDLAELVGSRVELRRAGSDFKACCPFHHEKTPSFVVHPDKGYYHCFGCGKSGDAITFVMETDGLPFAEAVRKLAERCGVKIEEEDDGRSELRARLYSLHAEISAFFSRCLAKTAEAAPARAYLERRGLDAGTVERFKIGYCPSSPAAISTWAEKHGYSPEELAAAGVLLPPRVSGGRPFNRFAGRLMFSISDRQGRVTAFSGRVLDKASSPAKYVNSPETAIFVKSRTLYALDLAAREIVKTPRREAIVCEGQIDVIRCHACGFPQAVASQGTAFTEEHVNLLKRVADSAVLIFDGDAAGRKAAIRTGALFLKAGIPVRAATLPQGEDPDSFLLAKGADAFKAVLDSAESIVSFQTRTLLAAEEDPKSAGAVQRTARAVLETVAGCDGAVLREALVSELAALIAIPRSALEDDLARLQEKRRSRERARKEERRTEVPPRESAEASGAPPPGEAAPGAEAPGEAPEIPPELDASSPANNPPPAEERALCEFLVEHSLDSGIAETVRESLPEAVRLHPFTRRFVSAWLGEASGSNPSALVELFSSAGPAERAWMDEALGTRGKTVFSELPPEKVLRDFLRRLWAAEADRRREELPAESTQDTDRERLGYSLMARKFRRAPWKTAADAFAALARAGGLSAADAADADSSDGEGLDG